MIKFSIVIPVYNASRFLDKCLISCLNQTYTNIEIICVDDGSTDNSREIIQDFAKKDARIKYFFHAKNESQYMARRTGMRLFSEGEGDYLLFLDNDDTLRHDSPELLAKEITKTQVDMIMFGYREVPAGKKILVPFYPRNSRELIAQYFSDKDKYSWNLWQKTYSRTVVMNALSLLDCFYSAGPDDLYISIVLAYCAQSFNFIHECLVNYSLDGMSSKKIYSEHKSILWLISYQMVMKHINVFIVARLPEFTERCLPMEIRLLKDFLSRIPDDVTPDLKHHIFDILPSYFSSKAIYKYIEELKSKAEQYDKYLNLNVSFIKRIKKWVKVNLRFLTSFITYHR